MLLAEWIKRLFRRRPPAPLPAAGAAELLEQLQATHPQEYSCDDVLRLLDQFAEAALRGEDVAALMPLVQRHLEMCPDCREEYEALLRILRASAA